MDGPRGFEFTDTIRRHEKFLFFVYFVYFVVQSLRRAQARRMAPLHLPEAARDHLDPTCSRPTARRLWNHEMHENPGPQAQGKGCRIGRFVCGRSKVNAHGAPGQQPWPFRFNLTRRGRSRIQARGLTWLDVMAPANSGSVELRPDLGCDAPQLGWSSLKSC